VAGPAVVIPMAVACGYSGAPLTIAGQERRDIVPKSPAPKPFLTFPRVAPRHQLQELEEFLVTVPGVGLAGHLASGDVEGGEERGGAVAQIVVGAPLHLTGTHGQQRLGPIEGLDLALLIDTEHHRMLRRVQLEPDHIRDLVLQLGVGAELEAASAIGLEVVIPPDPQHRRPAGLNTLSHVAARPASGFGRQEADPG
jgi:hypothetical protein